MRNYLLLALTFTLVLSSQAQKVTYIAGDLGQIGDIFHTTKLQYDSANFLSIDDVDAEMWNFSSIEPEVKDTVAILSKDDFPELDSLPENTRVMEDEDNSWLCLQLEDNVLQMLGMLITVEDQRIPYIFDEPQPMLVFPLTIGAGGEETMNYSIYGTPEEFGLDTIPSDSMRFNINMTATNMVEDTGIVVTQQYSYSVFKVKSTNIFSVDVWIKSFGIWIPAMEDVVSDSTIKYQYFTPEYGIPVVEVNTTWNDKIMSFQMIDEDPNGLFVRQKNDLQIFPVPTQAGSQLHFSQTLSQISIYDMSGRKVFQNMGSTQHINLPEVKDGYYIIKAKEFPQGKKIVIISE